MLRNTLIKILGVSPEAVDSGRELVLIVAHNWIRRYFAAASMLCIAHFYLGRHGLFDISVGQAALLSLVGIPTLTVLRYRG